MKQFDNKELLSCHFSNGMMMLPFYHYGLVEKYNNPQGINIKTQPHYKRVLNLLYGIKRIKPQKKNIIIFSSTLFNFKQRDGRYRNILHGYYYDLYKDDTLLIEDGDRNNVWRTRDSCDALCFINTYFIFISSLIANICNRIYVIKRKDFEPFIKEDNRFFSVKSLSKDDYYVRVYSFLLKRLFCFVNPKVAIVNCASYGQSAAVICNVARRHGVKIIEPQHGVTRRCSAYEVSDIVSNCTEYYDYLPDTFFSFGDYWQNYVKWKYEKISVGYPDLIDFLGRHVKECKDCEYTFLVISQPMGGRDEKEKEHFVRALASSFPEHKCLLRIHPMESADDIITKYKDLSNLSVSLSSSLYDDFLKSNYVIGWFSNCLYEALAFGKMPIIVDTPLSRNMFPDDIGKWIKNVEDLNHYILHVKKLQVPLSDFWTLDYQKKVVDYLNKYM